MTPPLSKRPEFRRGERCLPRRRLRAPELWIADAWLSAISRQNQKGMPIFVVLARIDGWRYSNLRMTRPSKAAP